jgi:hypothetical protein
MPANVPKHLEGKFERCKKKVKAKGQDVNEYAVCYESVVAGKDSIKKVNPRAVDMKLPE